MALERRKKIKSSRVRSRKIDKTFEYAAYVLITLYGIYLVIVWVSVRPSLFIDNIVVDGTHAVSSSSIQMLAQSKLKEKLLYRINRNNELLYPMNVMKAEVLALSPRLAHIDTSFDTRHTLRIKVTEFTPNFLYCMGTDKMIESASSTPTDVQPKDCYFADEEGYVYAEAPEYVGYPFVSIIAATSEEAVTHPSPIGTKVISEADYALIQAFIDDLSKVGLTTHSVTLLGGNDVRVEVGMPWAILFTTNKDAGKAITNLGVVLENLDKSPDKGKSVREIDLRFGNKIFYK